MPLAPLLLSSLLLLGQETTAYRQWLAGQETGGSTETLARAAEGETFETHQWSRIERMGMVVHQDLRETALKRPDGSLRFTWSLAQSQEPQEGSASWSPREPGRLEVRFSAGPPRTVEIPPDLLLWPGDVDAALRRAAQEGRPVKVRSFSFPIQMPTELDLEPQGPSPLPGFPDAVRFRGRSREGELNETVTLWISPTRGEIKHSGTIGGIQLISQRKELPSPLEREAGSGLFERTISGLPPHPFLLWLPQVRARWTGSAPVPLPEDGQQRLQGEKILLLTRALPPARKEAPVKGAPEPEDAPYLAPTPLVQFDDPVFEGLVRRLGAPADADRWELARRVTAFVYDWVENKNFAVGFASAQEVARRSTGDCTEHGVLAVALLRRLGVPARGVTGWVALQETMGLHFWVEVKIGGRWIPVDPTFDQAPASTYRVKLGTTDLAGLGNLGWERAASSFLEGQWIPDGPWAREVDPQGDRVAVGGDLVLRLAAARWRYRDGRLVLLWGGEHPVEASPRPQPGERQGALRLKGSRSAREGWWNAGTRDLWADLGEGRWLKVGSLSETQAHGLLDGLELLLRQPRAARR